jgi:hypothetical protein
MTGSNDRSRVVSSFTIIKGALIPETYELFKHWDFSLSRRENLTRMKREDLMGAGNVHWLRDLGKVFNRRFDPASRDRPLVELAKSGCQVDIWRPLLLWHITRDEFLLRDFLVNWLYSAFSDGVLHIGTKDVLPYLEALPGQDVVIEGKWSDSTTRRVATGLLKIAVDFELLQGSTVKEFRSYHLPDVSFLYILHAVCEREHHAKKVIDLPDWRMYLMAPNDVERELFRLHQYRKLDYQVAGSVQQLSLPYHAAAEYARRMTE